MSSNRAINEALAPLMQVKSGASGDSDAGAVVGKYMTQVSALTAPQTEMDMKDIELKAATLESDQLVSMIRKRLSNKKQYGAILKQQLESVHASEEVFKNQLDTERRNREQIQRGLLETKSEVMSLKSTYTNQGRKQVEQAKHINRLDQMVKDLQGSFEETLDMERKASIALNEAEKKSRELAHELVSVRVANTRLTETNDTKVSETLVVVNDLQDERDKLTRNANAAKVKVIALKKANEEFTENIARWAEEMLEMESSISRLRDSMRVEKALAVAAINELNKHLGNEAAANKQLWFQLGEKEKQEIQMKTDLLALRAAKTLLSEQLTQKMIVSKDLSQRLDTLQNHAQVLAERLRDKDAESGALKQTLAMLKSDASVLQMQLGKEQHSLREAANDLEGQRDSVVALGKKVTEGVTKGHFSSLRLKQNEMDAAILQEDLDEVRNGERAKKQRLLSTEEGMDMMQLSLDENKMVLTDLKDRLKIKCTEHVRLNAHLKDETAKLMDEEHQKKIELNDLQDTLRLKVDQTMGLRNGLTLNEVKIKDLTEMLESASVSAEQNKQDLSRRVADLNEANQLLKVQIEQEQTRGALLGKDLENAEGVLRLSLTQIKAQENTNEGLAKVNQDEQELIMQRLQMETMRVEKLVAQCQLVEADIQSWEVKIEDELQEKSRTMANLKKEKSLTNKLRSKLEDTQEKEMATATRIKVITQKNKDLDLEEEQLISDVAEISIKLDDFNNTKDMLQQELREQTLKVEELTGVENKNRAKMVEVQANLVTQKGRHLAEARAVKISIERLQKELMEKAVQIEQLIKQTQLNRDESKALQERLEETDRASDASRSLCESMLQTEQRTAATLREKLKDKRLSHAIMTASMERKVDKMSSLETTLTDSAIHGEILKSDESTKRKEAEQVANELERSEARERNLSDKIAETEDMIAELRIAKKERKKREEELRKTIKQAKYENKFLKGQAHMKSKEERFLLAELEALRVKNLPSVDDRFEGGSQDRM